MLITQKWTLLDRNCSEDLNHFLTLQLSFESIRTSFNTVQFNRFPSQFDSPALLSMAPLGNPYYMTERNLAEEGEGYSQIMADSKVKKVTLRDVLAT